MLLAVPVPVPLRWIDLQADSIVPAWQRVLSHAQSRDRRAALKALNAVPFVYANDHHFGALELARQAAELAGVRHLIDFRCQDAGVYRPAQRPGIIVTNPPWDLRLHGAEDSWQALAQFTTSIGSVQADRMVRSSTASRDGDVNGERTSSGLVEETAIDQRVPSPPAASAQGARGQSSKLDLWVLSGSEKLSCRYFGNRPQVRIPIRAASNDLYFNRYSV